MQTNPHSYDYKNAPRKLKYGEYGKPPPERDKLINEIDQLKYHLNQSSSFDLDISKMQRELRVLERTLQEQITPPVIGKGRRGKLIPSTNMTQTGNKEPNQRERAETEFYAKNKIREKEQYQRFLVRENGNDPDLIRQKRFMNEFQSRLQPISPKPHKEAFKEESLYDLFLNDQELLSHKSVIQEIVSSTKFTDINLSAETFKQHLFKYPLELILLSFKIIYSTVYSTFEDNRRKVGDLVLSDSNRFSQKSREFFSLVLLPENLDSFLALELHDWREYSQFLEKPSNPSTTVEALFNTLKVINQGETIITFVKSFIVVHLNINYSEIISTIIYMNQKSGNFPLSTPPNVENKYISCAYKRFYFHINMVFICLQIILWDFIRIYIPPLDEDKFIIRKSTRFK
jgi:hypothetical protein